MFKYSNMETGNETKNNSVKGFIESVGIISSRIADKKIELAFKNQGIENLEEILEKAKRETIDESKKEIKKEINDLKKDFFVIFGIFASFITFVVGEISILKTIDNIYDKIGFSFLFVSFILGFLFGIMFLLDSEVINDKYKKIGSVFTLFFMIGLGFILMPHLVIKI
jgi:hypothetical protein